MIFQDKDFFHAEGNKSDSVFSLANLSSIIIQDIQGRMQTTKMKWTITLFASCIDKYGYQGEERTNFLA